MEKREKIAGITYLLIGLGVVFHSLKELGLGTVKLPGPGFFPLICGVCIVVFSGIWLATSWKAKTEQEDRPFWDKGEWIRPTMAVILTIGYAAFMDDLGFVLTRFLFSVAWQIGVEREKWLKNLLISVGCTAAMYLLFQYLLSVPLPRGMFI